MKPELELVFELNGVLDQALVVGDTPQGLRRMVAIQSGTVEGRDFRAVILPGGGDWQFLRSDGVSQLDARRSAPTHRCRDRREKIRTSP